MQAAAMKEILEKNGHEIQAVFKAYRLFKKNDQTEYKTGIKVSFFLSPFFISSGSYKGINLWKSFLVNLLLVPVYIIEIFRLGIKIRLKKPDMVLNFYDITGGLALLLTGRRIRKYVISHHFFFEHQDFIWPVHRKFEKMLLLIHSFLTSFSARRKLALSFTPAGNIPEKKIFIIPPILRNKVLIARTEDHGHIHIYTLRPGYYQQVIRLCVDNPGLKIRMFSDFRSIPLTSIPNLEFSNIEEEKFFNSLISCSLVICTAGFETPAESAYLGKALGVIPSENHFEQYCNAVDLERSGLGYKGHRLSDLIDINKRSFQMNSDFREWVLKAEKLILEYLEI